MSDNDKTTKELKPVHPGEVLLHEFLEPSGMSQNQLARALMVNVNRINAICREKHRITPEMALRLAHYYGMAASFWMGLQTRYDLDIAKDKWAEQIAHEVRPEVDGKDGLEAYMLKIRRWRWAAEYDAIVEYHDESELEEICSGEIFDYSEPSGKHTQQISANLGGRWDVLKENTKP
jgi:addiction module HigA family antidote